VKRTLALFCALALAALIAVAGARSSPRPSSYVLPGNDVFPEGIDFWPKTGQFFVTGAGNGSIMRGQLDDANATVLVPATGVPFSTIGVKVDKRNELLYVAGGGTGTVRVYSAVSGALLRTFTSGAGGFINDLVIAEGGDVFATDSFRPTLWRIPAGATGGALEPWLSFAGTPLQYTPGFNVNGIVQTQNAQYLIVVQSSTGKLFRITIDTKAVQEIDLGGESVAGDGLELIGRTLYAVADGAVAKVRLAGDFLSGEVLSRTTDPSFDSPTTLALARGRLLVVNSQFQRMATGPILPFTVSAIPAP
jgi:Cu-Zn family superoxide dismutase